MSLIKAFDDSEAAGATSNQKADTGPDNPAALGYIEMKSDNEPAQKNSDITSIKSFGKEVDLGQEGTSIDAYKHQPETVSAESGE